MNSVSSNTYSYNDFNFSMQTSSGDTINLKMYDERSLDIAQSQDETSTLTTLSLSHAYGYSFEYKGNGIDANDQKEIEKAMKQIEPMMDDYLKSVAQNESNDKSIINTAFDINAHLPKSTNADTNAYLNDKTLKTIDKVLEKAEHQNEKILKEAQKLFDALLKQRERFELYM